MARVLVPLRSYSSNRICVPIAVVLLGISALGMYTRAGPLTMLTQTILMGSAVIRCWPYPYIMAG